MCVVPLQVCVCVRVCVRQFVCVFKYLLTHQHMRKFSAVSLQFHTQVCMRKGEKESERDRERLCLYVCV